MSELEAKKGLLKNLLQKDIIKPSALKYEINLLNLILNFYCLARLTQPL